MNRQCSFGQTNNPLENVFQHIPESINTQSLNNEQSQQYLQNNQENIFNFNNSSGNSFQQTFNYEWNQALSGNGYGQKNTSFISEDQIQIILQQCRPKPQEGQELIQHQQNNCVTSKQTNVQNLQTFEQKSDNHFSELQRLQELDYKRIQTEESSNDSLIYKGEEVDKILSRYSFQMLQENNETQKLQENNYLQNTPGSLSYSVNDMKSYSDNAQQQSGPGVDQDSSINFNLKPPLGNFGQVQCFNDQNNLSNNTLNQNLINNQQQLNQFAGTNGNQINNTASPNNCGFNSQQLNPPNVYLNGQSQVLASSNINIQEYINSSKSDLFSNNLSGIKWSLMSQGSSGTYFPTSNALNNQTSHSSIKQIPSGSTFVTNTFLTVPQGAQGGSSSADQQKQLQKQEDQIQILQGGSGQQTKQIIPQNNNLNFQKLQNNFNHMSEQSFKCQECALNKQQISFLQIQLKESQEREDVQKKLNDSLMIALSQVQEEKPSQAEGSIQSGRSEILRDFYEKEIKQLREQMNNRQKSQEQIGKELIKKCDELENQKISLELQLKDFKNKVDEKNIEINEITSSLTRKDYQIFQLSEEIKKYQQQAQGIDENRVTNLEKQLDQMQKNHNNEIILMQSETEKEIQKYNLLLTKTVDSFETKIKQILTEKNLIEKANASNTEISSDLLQKLNDENIVLKQQKESAFKQIEAMQKQMEQQKIQVTAQSSLLSQIEEQERTIEQLQGISLAHDSLQVQYAQQAANIKHLQMKIKEVQQSYQDLKVKRDNELKQSTSKYAELASKCSEIQSNSDRMKKDFQRKSAMIIREILNKDMKIRQLSQKIQIIQGNSSPFNSSNGSNLQTTTNQQKREKSPLNKLLCEDKMLSDNINFVEFNKSQLLNSPNQLMNNTISTNNKNNLQADQEKLLEGLQSRSRSPVGRNTQNTQQFWLNFMDLSNISSDNLLNAAQNHLFNEEDEDNQFNGLNTSNINTEELKSKYLGLLHQRNVLENTINELKLQLNKKNELEVCLKNEIRFVVEYLVQTLADQIVLDIREKENQTPQGYLSPSSRVYDPSKTQGSEEERIVRETDKILKQHIIKLQQKAIQSHMVECYNILNSILGANTPLPKPKQEKTQQIQTDQKIKSSNKLSQSQQECQSSSSSSLSKRALRQIDQKHNQQNKSNSPFSKQSASHNQQQNLIKNEFSASTKLLKISQQSSLSKNNISLNASNMSNNSPTKFKKQSLKLSDLKVDYNKQKSKQQKQQSSPLIKQQNTPTRSQKIQKFGYFLSKQQNQNQSQNKLSIKTNESNLSHNLSINNNIV
ncbi:hypothetical protein ABPG74_003969 [Tetrahymena malaccensis]